MSQPVSMNPSRSPGLWQQRALIGALIRRELAQRYRGSFLGIGWSVLVPLVMLLIYTFVFALVLKARWGDAAQPTSTQEFALIIFAGLIPFNVFSEVVNRSSGLIVGMPNYVKKVVFPLEIYPVVLLGVALTTSLISVVLLVLGRLVLLHTLSWEMLLLPLAYLPLILLCLGLSWILASLGVYIRDVIQVVPIVVQIMLFMSPIFYPPSIVPARLQFIFVINPLTTIIDSFRQILLWNQPLPWLRWSIWLVVTLLLAWGGYRWFMATRKGFADVL